METTLISHRDFIIFGLQPWDIPSGSNCKNMAEEISKNNRVLYVNRPMDRISKFRYRNDPRIRNRLESIREGKNVLNSINNNLWVLNPPVMLESINFLPHGPLYNLFNRRNNKILAAEIVRASKQLGFADTVLLIDNDFLNGFYLADFLSPSVFVYYIRDFLLSQPYFKRHGREAEPLMIKRADAVTANSKYLASYASGYNSAATDIGQGCETADFLEIPSGKAPDMAGIPHPVIGYCGALTATRLDIELLKFIATEKPAWSIVLVGPEDEVFRASELHQMPNVHFLGAKSVSELPIYIHGFDVCLNPQLVNQMTIGNYPRKIDEYLAAGKPVVATQTEAMEMFEGYVYLCVSKEEYIIRIGEALDEPIVELKKEERRAVARSHTWAASVQKLYEAILKTGK